MDDASHLTVPGFHLLGTMKTKHDLHVTHAAYGPGRVSYDTHIAGFINAESTIAYILGVVEPRRFTFPHPPDDMNVLEHEFMPTKNRILVYSEAAEEIDIITGTLN